ncbi:DUF4012 domain-containing protein [Microbacterium sp.]|uniref:DUF4012 domain-containing protein n=1 Tax=Microbacterium sp. TaxID=51671 RepID=UPI003C72D521
MRPEDDHADARPAKRRRRRWPWVLFGSLTFALIALAAGAAVVGLLFMSDVNDARRSLDEAKYELSTLSTQLATGDEAAIAATADRITADVADAAAIVEGPLWQIAARVPFVGQNVDAVQRVTRAVDILVKQALPPGTQVMAAIDFDKITVEGGGINLEPFRQAQGAIPEISAAFTAAEAEVAPIDRTELLPEVVEPIDDILSIIQQAAPTLDVMNRYMPTLLDMAGSNGTKTYLVIFQNNAEIRATGGNPAASMILTMTDGALGYADQASSQTFYEAGAAGNVYTAIPEETTNLYLSGFTRYSQDYTMSPDFPTTAQLFQDVWAATSGAHFDGVISIDPTVLSHMLAVAGPATLSGGEQVTAENAVKLVLSDAYERYPNGAESDAFFADVSKSVFNHLTSAQWDPMAMLAALEQSAKEQRVYLAFVDPAAQALSTELGVDGALPADLATQTQVGMYLNDSSVSKLEYHLTSTITATCDAGARTLTTTMTLHNGITDDIQSPYTLGYRNGGYGIPRTTMMLDVLTFAPPGASIVSTVPAVGEVSAWERTGTEKGSTAVSKTVFVAKDETVTVASTVAFPEGQLGPLYLRHTPTAHDTPVTIDPSCDALFGSTKG